MIVKFLPYDFNFKRPYVAVINKIQIADWKKLPNEKNDEVFKLAINANNENRNDTNI